MWVRENRGSEGGALCSGQESGQTDRWWWTGEIQARAQRKRSAKKKLDTKKTDESRQKYMEMQHKEKVEKAKQKNI